MDKNGIRIRMIQEIAGYPEDHVIESMDKMNGRLANMEGVKIIEREVHDPKEVKDGIWSMFADIELQVRDFSTIVLILFDFMPSSIEIIEPSDKLVSDVPELTGAINDLIGKMHHLDATAKKFFAANNVLTRKLRELEKTASQNEK